MGYLYGIYRLGWIGYDLANFRRHPLVSAFFIAMGILALVSYGRRGKGWRR